MKRKLFSMLAAMLCLISASTASAQQQQLTPLPLNPQVKAGVLPNGLHYYVLHNEEPKERANFYIAQKVGSTLETPEQLGLAHFLEHMAFNGTKNYPGKDLLNYLQHKGIRFGADINAYTSFDETVYNINNIPTTDVALMDSVLLALHDWSGSILLEESEINSERGVINGEWRQRNNAQTRMYTTILPQLYKEYQYQQMPIGKMEVVMNFPPQAIRDYYEKWYRPDQQAIIVVGDFDAAEMEKKVIAVFTDIPMPENAAPREYAQVSDNEKPIYAYFADPELKDTRITVSFKYDKTPVELRSTVEAYAQDHIMLNLIAGMINNRLNEYQQDPKCEYADAGCWFGDYYISKTKGSFDVIAIAKQNPETAFADAMSVVARACKTGFTDSEMARVSAEMLSGLERMYNERNKTESESLARELINYFVDNNPAPGIETEYELAKMLLGENGINVQILNQIASQILTSNNQVICLSQPQTEGMVTVTEEVMTSKLNEILNSDYEAYVDEVITEPLIAKLPKPGKIASKTYNEEFGSTEYILKNGARVIVKPTDFAADQIIMSAYRFGGKQTYPASQKVNLDLMGTAFDWSKWGPFDTQKLMKYLAGKKVGLGYEMNQYSNTLSGSSTVKDLPTFMELLYTSFTSLSPDETAFAAEMSKLATALANQDKNPQFQFRSAVTNARYGNNPMTTPLHATDLANANYAEMLKMIKATTSNAAEYTFVFTGNIDLPTFEIMMNQYIGSLPGNAKKAVKAPVITPIVFAKGNVENDFTITALTPAVDVFASLSGNDVSYDLKNETMIDFVGEILQIIYTETLREEMGGTYGAGTAGYMNPYSSEWCLLYQFQTNPEQKKDMIDRAQSELHKLLREGAKPEYFNKVKEAALKQLEIQERTNSYWSQGLTLNARGFNVLSNARAIIESITIEDLNTFMRALDSTPNRLEVIMNSVEQ